MNEKGEEEEGRRGGGVDGREGRRRREGGTAPQTRQPGNHKAGVASEPQEWQVTAG